ncbi:MAG: hypothetical protein J5994_09560 [Ruminococcus sp.]|nr:hypothetical protein [Ruminococcus sp.]
MDSFKEQIVKKQKTHNDSVKKLLIMIASVALAFSIIFIVLAFPRIAVIGIFLACLSIYGGYYIIQSLNVEYEYIFTNGDLDIDKIIAQRSRKRLVSINVGSVTAAGVVDDSYSVDDGRTLVYASACDPELTDYYFDVTHKNLGDISIIITADDDMLRLIKTHLPRTLRTSLPDVKKTSEE